MSNISLKKEVAMLRSLAVSLVGRDAEGEYRPEFVEKILRSPVQKTLKKFTTATAFLKELRKNG
jgi:hypothetical protein